MQQTLFPFDEEPGSPLVRGQPLVQRLGEPRLPVPGLVQATVAELHKLGHVAYFVAAVSVSIIGVSFLFFSSFCVTW